jgi:hypothetical protein
MPKGVLKVILEKAPMLFAGEDTAAVKKLQPSKYEDAKP